MYYCREKVKVKFMVRWKNNKWKEKGAGNDIAFYEHHKIEYLEENSTHLEISAKVVDGGKDGTDAGV